MSRVEVLVATMNQTDFSLFEKMNIQTDVIVCNQCDRNEFIETEINGCRVRMLSTTTKGVGINRNLAMQLSDAEICLCADDDVKYVDGYEEIICNNFDSNPKASVIVFNMTSTGYKQMSNYTKKKGFSRRSYGGCRLAYRRDIIMSKNISFNTNFGGGSKYGSGEDSLFIRELCHNGVKIYATTDVIGNIDYANSSWFHGYTEKFYFDKGAWCRAAYSKMWRLYKYYLVLKQTKLSKLSFIKVAKLMNKGAKAYKLGLSYEEYKK